TENGMQIHTDNSSVGIDFGWLTLIAWLVFAAGLGCFVVGMSETQGQRHRLINKRRRPAERVLDGPDDLILILPEAERVAVLIEDHKQNDAAGPGLHLAHERAGAAVSARERSGLGDYAAARGRISVAIFQRAGIDTGNRQNV